MLQLAEKSGEAVALCTVDGDQVRYLSQVMIRFEPEAVVVAMVNELLAACERLSEIVSGATT